MVFDQIEQLKRQYTDQFVVVDEHRPELARFRGYTGRVKTVNMNGRALVEFDDYIANIGWYDIDLSFLTVVPKPDPATAAAKPARPAAEKPGAAETAAKAKPAPKAPAAAAKPAAAKPAAAKPATAGKMNTAAILAAARTKKGEAAPAVAAEASAVEAPAAEASMTVAPEAPPAKPAAKPAAAGASKSSSEKPTTTAEKIALCRRIDSKS